MFALALLWPTIQPRSMAWHEQLDMSIEFPPPFPDLLAPAHFQHRFQPEKSGMNVPQRIIVDTIKSTQIHASISCAMRILFRLSAEALWCARAPTMHLSHSVIAVVTMFTTSANCPIRAHIWPAEALRCRRAPLVHFHAYGVRHWEK